MSARPLETTQQLTLGTTSQLTLGTTQQLTLGTTPQLTLGTTPQLTLGTTGRLTAEMQSTPLASLARRYAALSYEATLLSAIVLLAGFLTLPATRAGTGGTLALPPLPARVFSFCLVFGIAGLYFIWCWTGGRRTLPMKTWRMALVRVDGRTVDAKAAVLRYLCAWIGAVVALVAYEFLHPINLGAHAAWFLATGFVWPIVDRERQFLHDRIAGTRLVMTPVRPSSAAPAQPQH